MSDRISPYKVLPAGYKVMMALEEGVAGLGVEAGLRHLVKLRASQINGCAYCISLHNREARADGETQYRLDLLSAWRETSIFSERERGALAWTEALTVLGDEADRAAAYDAMTAAFTPEEVVAVSLVITTINAWNRLGVGFHIPPLRPPAA